VEELSGVSEREKRCQGKGADNRRETEPSPLGPERKFVKKSRISQGGKLLLSRREVSFLISGLKKDKESFSKKEGGGGGPSVMVKTSPLLERYFSHEKYFAEDRLLFRG